VKNEKKGSERAVDESDDLISLLINENNFRFALISLPFKRTFKSE
jgi:hypothetical protein